VYQLSLFGAATVGAWLSGHAIAAVGVLTAIGTLGALTVVTALVAIKFSDLWQPLPNDSREG
jgi:hypothetical protein